MDCDPLIVNEFFRTQNRNRNRVEIETKIEAILSKGTYCFMKPVSHTHILTHVLSQCETCTAHFVLCCNPKMPETSLCPSSQTSPPLLLGPLQLLSPCRPQALNRRPAVFFIGCLHKPWPFTVTHKLLLIQPGTAFSLIRPMLTHTFGILGLFSGLGSASNISNCFTMNNKPRAAGLHFFVCYLSSPMRKKTSPKSLLK